MNVPHYFQDPPSGPIRQGDENDRRLDHIDAVAHLWLEHAQAEADEGRWDAALHGAHMAARTRAMQNRVLAWPALEAFLREAALHLWTRSPEGADALQVNAGINTTSSTCLHVISEALPAGGLTAMATRWMELDTTHATHEVALLDATLGVPRELARVVASRKGQVHCAPPDSGPVERARWLHQLACQRAQHVVLHVDPADVICGVAFGQSGGPPVLLVNHTAHSFWVGVSTSDLILNCRGSALESTWTRDHRGTAHQACVPIPLDETFQKITTQRSRAMTRQRARAGWGLKQDQVVLLTVGSAFKYVPVPQNHDTDFVATFERLLQKVPQAVLLAVGFEADGRWKQAEQATGGRMRALGTLPQSALRQLHAASDVYVEGFPFGTTTALLEACAAGLPVLLPPQMCPPPYATDGIALDGRILRDATWTDYETTCMQLLKSPSVRQARAAALTPSVLQHHTGQGWRDHLQNALHALPTAHRVRQGFLAQPVPASMVSYWEQCKKPWASPASSALEHSLLWALQSPCKLPAWPALQAVCRPRAQEKVDGGLSPRVLWVWRHGLVPVLPRRWAAWVLRAGLWLQSSKRANRPGPTGLLARWRGQKAKPPVGAYEEYRRWGQRTNLKWDAP